jgi:hypothetical protein
VGEVVTPGPEVEAGNRFSILVRDGDDGQGTGTGNGQGNGQRTGTGNGRRNGQGNGWSVAILDPQGREVAVRACRDETEARTFSSTEARTFASTVRQHIAWLSEARFREIYLLPEVA